MKEFRITEDGSHTLYLPELNETYHSSHGAVSESLHVFINAGLKAKFQNNDSLNILEVGFGTGLNAALTFFVAEKNNVKINYFSLEPNPLSFDEVEKLNYNSIYGGDEMKNLILKLHSAENGVKTSISDNFLFCNNKEKIQEISLESDFYDLVYYDAFSPSTQPEMWTMPVFEKIYSAMRKNALLVTYVAKGEVRRTLKSCGFTVEKLPGFAGKREMTRAVKYPVFCTFSG